MPNSWRRGVYEKVEYVVVERDGAREEPPADASQFPRRSYTRRQAPSPTESDDESDSDDDDYPMPISTTTRTPVRSAAVESPPSTFLITMTLGDNPSSSAVALADNDPKETIIVALPPPPMMHGDSDSKISQTTEHLLIAAGSIGATIIVVMIILALYTMRKRGLSFMDLLRHGQSHVRRGPPPPLKYGPDNKQQFGSEYSYGRRSSIAQPQLAASSRRSNSLSTRAPIQDLGRSNSFGQRGLERNPSSKKTFYDDSLSRSGSHRRNDSATPSSPVLPVQGRRQSASSRNTRSLTGDEEPLRYSDPPADRALPAPPTFKQFLSNRPNISQRPQNGAGGMASRSSWTNSQAPQTPHDPSRDTVAQPLGRDSFMTARSSVPRFRTVDPWVNQQSNRVEALRLKQQFRMTQSSTSSGDETASEADKVPEMPSMPTTLSRKPSGLAGKNVKHARHDTETTVQTAAIFRAHPGTEVRISTRSTVPSEVLDMGRKNTALE